MSFTADDLIFICCPACHVSLSLRQDPLLCGSCGHRYFIADGIPQLVTQPELHSQLEQIDYDGLHAVNENSFVVVSENWQRIFAENQTRRTTTLELGAGTGQLSKMLASDPAITKLFITDISPTFLKQARRIQGHGDTHHSLIACDANHLPFQNNCFDLVVGHSVMHHFLDYQEILARCLKLLKPGGQAIFFEPVLQGKAKLALLLHLVYILENQGELGILDKADLERLKKMRAHILKGVENTGNRELLAAMEDKYIFHVGQLIAFGKSCGFADVRYSNWKDQNDYYRIGLEQHMILAGIDAHKAQQFRFLTRAWRENMVALLPEEQYTPMGFFVFCKH